MPRMRLHAPLATTLAAAGLLSLAATAPAATRVLPADIDKLPRGGAIEYGLATVKLTGGAAGKLRSAGTTISAGGSAKVKGTKIELSTLDKGSVLDPTQMVGVAPVDGTLTLKGRKGTAKLTAITFQPGGQNKNVTAKLGGKLFELGTLKGGKAKFSKLSDGDLTGAKIALTARAAKTLNAKTGGGFAAGSFGTLALEITTRELPIKNGVAKMTIDPALLKLINDNGVDVAAVPPATREGSVVSIPIVAGAFDPEGLTGRLSMEGTINVVRGDSVVPLYGWRGAIGASQKELFAKINSAVAAPVATIDVSSLTSQFEGTGYIANGAKLNLSKIAVDVLKQQFGVVMPVGTPLGVVNMSGDLSGRQ